MTEPRYILLDGDIASHFITGGYPEALPNIFPYEIKILRSVYNVLVQTATKKASIMHLVQNSLIQIIDFPDDNRVIYKEFLKLSKGFRTEGETACMAMARFSRNVIASSNLVESIKYFKENSVPYLTTRDFLDSAKSNGTLSLLEEVRFHTNIKAAGIKIPTIRNEEPIVFEGLKTEVAISI